MTGKTTNQREFIQISISNTYIRRNFYFLNGESWGFNLLLHISKQISKTQWRKSHHRALIAEELFAMRPWLLIVVKFYSWYRASSLSSYTVESNKPSLDQLCDRVTNLVNIMQCSGKTAEGNDCPRVTAASLRELRFPRCSFPASIGKYFTRFVTRSHYGLIGQVRIRFYSLTTIKVTNNSSVPSLHQAPRQGGHHNQTKKPSLHESGRRTGPLGHVEYTFDLFWNC